MLAQEGARVNILVNAVAPLARSRMTEGLLGDLAELLDPKSVTAVVTYLAHESCAVNGYVYSVAGGRVARIFMAETRGIVLPSFTPEAVRDNLEPINDPDGYLVPGSLTEATEIVQQALKA